MEYLYGESIRLENEFKDLDGALYDPTTVELNIYDPEGTIITTVDYATGDIKRTSLGLFFYDHSISSTATQGYYVATWTATFSVGSDLSEIQFYVRSPAEKLYCSVAQVKSGVGADKVTMSDENIRMAIRDAMAEVDQAVGRTFVSGVVKTEWFDTLLPNSRYGVNQIFLNSLPVQSITSLEEYSADKTLTKTWTDTDYYFNSNGIIDLCEGFFGSGRHRVKCVYESGYAVIPAKISKLCSIITQITVMREYMVQQDNAATGFTVEGISSVQVGESYTSTQVVMKDLTSQRETLIAEIGTLRADTFVV